MDLSPTVCLLRDEGAYRVLAAAQNLEREGHKVVHLEIGQPSFPTPTWIAEAGKDAISNGFTKYVNPSGTLEIKEAIAKHFSKTRSVNVSPDNVVVGPGAKPGLWFGVQAVVAPGDEILIPDPGFPAYENMAKVFGCVGVRYNALAKNIDKEIEQHLNSKTKVLILNSPSNPTGMVYSQEQLRDISTVLIEYPQVWIVSDEIYCHLTYGEEKEAKKRNGSEYEFPTAPSIVSVNQMLDRTIVVDGFSKAFQMTGWRLGFVICRKELAQKLHLLMTHAIGCTASFTQVAGVAALTSTKGAKEVVETVEEYQRRRDYVVNRLNQMPGVTCELPKGAFYAFADVSGLAIPAREFCDRCLNEGFVAILPGGDFGPKGEHFIRISYVGEMSILKEGMDRIEGVVHLINNKHKKQAIG